MKLPSTVILLGFTSLFADVGSEMIFPLLPVFVTVTLAASPALLGVVEGAADTVSSVLKLVAGRLSDRLGKRKPLVVFGYGLAGLVRPLMGLVGAPWQVVAIRLTDRIGKGIRSAPRDALIADAATEGSVGRAFGFHRAMDHAGAVIGPLVASALLAAGFELRTVFLAAALPSVLSVVTTLAVKDSPAPLAVSTAAPAPQVIQTPAISRRFGGFLGILLLFGLGNSSDAFLLLRAGELGVTVAELPLLWAFFHVSKLVSAAVGGRLADAVPRHRMVIAGWVVYSAVYVAFGFVAATWQVWGLFFVYGAYYGLTEPAEKALVRDIVPAEARGTAFGWYNFVVGVSALPAGLLMGALWALQGATLALCVGAGLAGASALALAVWSGIGWREPRPPPSRREAAAPTASG